MSDAYELTVHKSQWPASLAAQLHEALRRRRIPPKFLYETPRQVRQWLRLHELCSPARTDAECQRVYQASFDAAAASVGTAECNVLALGCGCGQKEIGLARSLESDGAIVKFLPCDVSAGLVITTLQHAAATLKRRPNRGLVCDLVKASVWSELAGGAGGRRLVTFFGLIPSLDPCEVTAIMQTVLRPGDLLACSANLVAGSDARAGAERILPQYDNEPTRSWLWVFLDDVGLTAADGRIEFGVEACETPAGVARITADFEFTRSGTAHGGSVSVDFARGERLRIFASYRHTPNTLCGLLSDMNLEGIGKWVSPDGSEGVWLFRHR